MHKTFTKLASKELYTIAMNSTKKIPSYLRKDLKRIRQILSQRVAVIKYLMELKKMTVMDLSLALTLNAKTIYDTLGLLAKFTENGSKEEGYDIFYDMFKKLIDIDSVEEDWNAHFTNRRGRGKYKNRLKGIKSDVPQVILNEVKEVLASVPEVEEEVLLDYPSEKEEFLPKDIEAIPEPIKEELRTLPEPEISKYNFERIMKKRMLALSMLRETRPEIKDNIDFLLNDIKAAVTKCLECLNQEYGDLRVKELETKSYSDDFHRKIEVIKKKFDIQVDYYNSINRDEKRTTETAKLTCDEIEFLGNEFNKILEKLF